SGSTEKRPGNQTADSACLPPYRPFRIILKYNRQAGARIATLAVLMPDQRHDFSHFGSSPKAWVGKSGRRVMKGNRRRPEQERSHPTTIPWSGTRVRPQAYAHMTITQRYQALFNWIASSQQNDGTRSVERSES